MPHKDPAARRAYMRQYHSDHRADLNERSKKYWVENREKLVQAKRDRYVENRPYALEWQKAYTKRNADALAEGRRAARRADPERFKEQDLKKHFGITLHEYFEMVAAQSGLCAICGEAETAKHQNGKVRRLSVDHCHQTGKIRGLLCSRCNACLGHARDSAKILMSAVDYLAKSAVE